MTIERKINEYGQESIIENADTIIKIGDRFMQVRLIKTQLWKDRGRKNPRYTKPMPRAKFVNPMETGFYYLVNKKDIHKMQGHNP